MYCRIALLLNAAVLVGAFAGYLAMQSLTTRPHAAVAVNGDPEPCNPGLAGHLYFDPAAKMFVGCDGQVFLVNARHRILASPWTL